MMRLFKMILCFAMVLAPLLLAAGCSEETPLPLLATLSLNHIPDETACALAVDSERGRAYIADGQRIRTIDLSSLEYVEPGSVSGVFYGIDDEDDLLAAISPDTGMVRQILAYDTPLIAEFATGMAGNPDTGTAFVLDIASPGGAVILYEMDMTTLAVTQIGPTGLGIDLRRALCLGRDPGNGTLYTVTPEDFLYSIDAETGLAVQAGYVGEDFDNIQGLAVSQGGSLYGIHSGNPSMLVLLDKATGSGSLAAELPLGYTFGSLCFKTDGTLWSVDLTRDALVQIDPETGSILTEFDTLVMQLPYKPDPAFEGIDSLTWFPSEPVCGRIYEAVPENTIDALTLCDPAGSVLAASINFLQHFDTTLGLTRAPVRPPFPIYELGPHFRHLLYCPETGLVYGRDPLKGLIYVINPASLDSIGEIPYTGASALSMLTHSTPLAIDPDTHRLFVQHHEGDVYIVDLGTNEVQELDYELPVEGLLADAERRRLYVATRSGSPGPHLDQLDLDSLERLNRASFDNLIGMMVLDPIRNRLAVNARIGITFTSKVYLYDLENFEKMPFSVSVDSLDPRMALDPVSNLLLLTVIETPPQVRIYELPG